MPISGDINTHKQRVFGKVHLVISLQVSSELDIRLGYIYLTAYYTHREQPPPLHLTKHLPVEPDKTNLHVNSHHSLNFSYLLYFSDGKCVCIRLSVEQSCLSNEIKI